MAKRRAKEDNLEKAKRQGKVRRIRTIKPNKDTYIHVGVVKEGGREKTVSGPVRHNKKKSR